METTTSIVISKVFVLLFMLIAFLSLVSGWLFYCTNIERATKWKNMKRITEKAAWWLSGGSGFGMGITFIMVMFNTVTFIEIWHLMVNFNIMSILTMFFVIIAAILMYVLIFRMVVEDHTDPQNYK